MKYVAALALLLVSSIAGAQTALKWNEDKVSWSAPVLCADGSPLTDCPISGYRVETAATQTATTWTTVTTVGTTVLQHTLAGVSEGLHCYRVIALSGTRASPPSNSVCVNTTPPAPGAPLVTVDTIAYEIRGTTTLSAARVGLVPLGAACGAETRKVGTVTYNRLPRAAVDMVNWPSNLKLTDVWARCG